jgi:glycosyltransferase involved in cell wall biosynthesis
LTRPLFLSYYFPPIGGAGAQRPAKFVRYLHELGHEPAVVTGPGEAAGRWTPRDETLSLEVPTQVRMRRAQGEPTEGSWWRRRGERWLWIQSAWTRWWLQESVAEGCEIGEVDAIYAMMSPYDSAEAAAVLSKRLGKPWIADLGDPWAFDEMAIYPTAVHRHREVHRMRRLLGTAAAIVTTTPEAARRIRAAFPELTDRPVVSIPCGFDKRDFAATPVPARTDDLFRIVHTGYLHCDVGLQQLRHPRLRRVLGGGSWGTEIIARSHFYLLQAIDRVISSDPDAAARIELRLTGVLSDADREIAAGSPVIRQTGYLPHLEALALMRTADLLFLPMQKVPPGIRSATVPGKTYEYLASGRPILGAVPDGATRDLILQSGAGFVCEPDDVDAMASNIFAHLAGEVETPEPDPALVDRFDYLELARAVGQVIEEVTGHGRRKGTRGSAENTVAYSAVVPSLTRPPCKSVPVATVRERRVLVLAYHFPPIGGAGAQRSLKFARYLPECGYAPSVLTGPGKSTGRWTPADESLLAELPPGTEIHRVGGPEPDSSERWERRKERWLGLQSRWSRWWIEEAVATGMEVGRNVDVIVASVSPYESATVAAILARKLGKPWVAGLRDPWVLDEMMIYPTGLHRRLELRRMRTLLNTSAGIITTTAEAALILQAQFPELAGRPIFSVPNGFDRNDFADPRPDSPHDAFRIVHSGYLHTDLGLQQRHRVLTRRILGGAVPGVDILTRSHVYLLEAIDRAVAADPRLATKIELHLAGVLSTSDRALTQHRPYVRICGYLEHREALALMRSADLLFLPMQNLPPGRRSATVPGKTYEYLAAQRLVLAAVPEGDARDILMQSGIATICAPNDVDAMTACLRSAVERWEANAPVPRVPQKLLEAFERRQLASEYASVLDLAVGERPGTYPYPRSVACLEA